MSKVQGLEIKGTICLYGAGVMGQALGQSILAKDLVSASRLWAVTKSEKTARKVRKELGIEVKTQNFAKGLSGCEVLILAVKPAQCRAALEELSSLGLSKKTLIISIVTGVPISLFHEILGTKAPIIRAVTNTPCTVGAGMSAFCADKSSSTKQKRIAQMIFESAGRCIEIEERQCEAMTALCGSGPAYFYLMIEALADGGVKVGVPKRRALEVVAQTMLGAAMMVLETGRHPAILRDEVATPGGTTIAALLVLEDGKIRSILARAIEAATKRARELGKA